MKLLLVDGSALLHRAYHAYPPLTNKMGEVVGAAYGVVSILYSALLSESPTHVVVAWDLPKPTFRHVKYVGYKAQRPKADSEMVEQIPLIKELIAAMGILQVEQEGYEADDIIGTLSKVEEAEEIIILTGDQDTMQLVSEKVKILTPAKGANPPVLYGVDEVLNKYGVHPNQIVDYKALIGDPSDNIPGVAGIGPKGAAHLLKMFETLVGIYDYLNNQSSSSNNQTTINEAIRQKLINGKESAFLSQDLSRIVTDMELNLELEKMEFKEIKNEVFKQKLEEQGFKSLIKRIWGDEKREKVDNQMGLF